MFKVLILTLIYSILTCSTAGRKSISESSTHMVSEKPYIVLERGDIKAVIVNNESVNDKILPGHRSGYSGVASLTHRARDKNFFVPLYAGLNFEHIHDGTVKPREILFEPREEVMGTRLGISNGSSPNTKSGSVTVL